MERKIYEKLLAWKKADTDKPLLLTGARQIGKSYILEKFCEAEYPNCLIFNLLEHPEIITLFEENISTQEKMDRLELLVGHKIDFASTVIFFDEVQESEDIISACKFFAESQTPYRIICAGSLLGVKINRFKKSFPVGKIHLLSMHPLDFEEFLWATGNDLLVPQIERCYQANEKMSGPLHEKLMKLYRQYLIVGGMPEVIVDFVANGQDVLLLNRQFLQDIRTSYLSDMNKYIKNTLESTRIEAVYNSAPSQLANKSKKFIYAQVKKGARSKDYASPLQWLISSGMIYRAEMVSKPVMPLKGYAEEDFFKLFLNDPGLLCSTLNIRPSVIMLDEDFDFKGAIAENYVACQLMANSVPLFYWRSENTAEIDFLLDLQEGVIPVEVKAGKRVTSPSLRTYTERFKPPYTVRISTKNFGFENHIKSVPLYAAWLLAQH